MSRSVNRALSILKLYDHRKKEWGISEISRELQMPKSTVYSLVRALVAEDFLRQTATGKYCLGIRLFELGRIYSEGNELTAVSAPMVDYLINKYKQTVHVAIYAGRRAVFVVNKKGEEDSGYSTFTRTGYDIPAYCTAVGKVLLAWQSQEHINHYLKTEALTAFTHNTITDAERLREEINSIRNQGYAIDRQETILGLGCIAAPIIGHSGQIVAAISISGDVNTILYSDRFKEYLEDVIASARKISESMCYE
ncbi:MAG: IclR family transcriptional regulator [Syntrophomonadaceae bacterium]|nr:IclR family transcriptional regulator [Syntrophomonadaceae bacterium]